MKILNKRAFTTFSLVIAIAAVAVVAAVIIPTFVGVVNKAEETNYVQAKSSQQMVDMVEKMDNKDLLTWDDFEGKIETTLATLSELVEEDVKNAIVNPLAEYMFAVKNNNTLLTEEQVKVIINHALATSFDADQVEAMYLSAATEANEMSEDFVSNDITLDGDMYGDIIINEGETVTINLNGYTLYGTITNYGTVRVINGTVKTNVLDNKDVFATIMCSGEAKFENVVIDTGTPWWYSVNAYGNANMTFENVTINGGGVQIANNSCVDFTGDIALHAGLDASGTVLDCGARYVFIVDNGATLNVYDGNFSINSNQNQRRAYIYAVAGADVNVYGGNFGAAMNKDGYRTGILGNDVSITGGNFAFDPSAWLAEGYEAVNNRSVWAVIKSADKIKNINVFDYNADITVNNGEVVTIDLQGNTYYGTIYNYGTLILKNGTLVAAHNSVENYGIANISDVTFNTTAGDVRGYFMSASGAESVTTLDRVNANHTGGMQIVNGAEVIFNSGNITLTSDSTSGQRYMFFVNGSANLTVNGGVFNLAPASAARKQAYIYCGNGSVATVNGGEFGALNGHSTDKLPGFITNAAEISIAGGTFKFNPTDATGRSASYSIAGVKIADAFELTSANSLWTVIAK